MESMKDKVVIITGGGAGIGLAAARSFLAGGARVLITGRRQAALDAVTTAAPNLAGLVADAGVPADAKRTVSYAVELWNRLDVLVNNAGAGAPLPLVESEIDRLRSIYAVNVVGPTLLAAEAIPHLSTSGGAIVNVSSTLAQKPVSGFSAYAASKAALEQLTRCWALELAPRGIRVNAVAAGPVETAFLEERMGYAHEAAEAVRSAERKQIPLGRRGEPADVAAWIVALASSTAGWITGQVVGVDGGYVLV
ncbi:MAG TPA: SDR family oxidoreductase [Phycisphaerae bacterium]|nr:SDR family oxidoreductase [Phycisphaerales bacterium]HRX86726.1 SDR family oxidoreductase [Phycisphaerae bacterium]